MHVSKSEPAPSLATSTSGSPGGSPDLPARIEMLTDRQRSYLRLVLQLKTSKEIAVATESSSYRAVDKQLMKASAILGVATRFEAAQALAAFEQGVESLHPANALPSDETGSPLSPPWPTAEAAVNMLTWKQVALWTAIIAIVTPVGLTAAGMAIMTLMLLLGSNFP